MTSKPLRIGVVGVGPRGVLIAASVITQIVRMALPHKVELLLIDPKGIGTGCHDPDLPDFILMNTPANQLTMFEEGCELFTANLPNGSSLNLAEWAVQNGYLTMPATNKNPASKPEKQYLPRKYLPQYTRYAFDCYLRMAPSNLEVGHLRATVTSIRRDANGFLLEMNDGKSVEADHVFISTGHAPADSGKGPFDSQTGGYRYLPDPYQVHQMTAIEAGHKVGIEGLGLTMFDVVAVLTEGRGGRFEQTSECLVYKPSGQEPELLLFSRRCQPPLSRPKVSDPLAENWSPRFFTREAIKEIRRQTGKDQLDFKQDVLPVLIKELAFFYEARKQAFLDDAEDFENPYDVAQGIETLLIPNESRDFRPIGDFRREFWEAIRVNLAMTFLERIREISGVFDIVKTLRAGLAEAIEFAGLTAQSHLWYNEVLSPAINRLSYGPPSVRNQKLLALHEAGIVEVAGRATTATFNPTTDKFEIAPERCSDTKVRADLESVDWVIKAHLPAYDPLTDPRPLATNLLTSGLSSLAINDCYRTGGFRIDAYNRSISSGGQAVEGLWIHGHPVESTRFYGHAIPRVGLSDRTFREVHQSVNLLFMNYLSEVPVRRGYKVQEIEHTGELSGDRQA